MKTIYFLLLFLLPLAGCPRTGLGLDGVEEDPEEYKIAHDLDRLLMPDTSGIDLPPPKDSVLYGQFKETSVSVEPAPASSVQLSRAERIAHAHEMVDDANFKPAKKPKSVEPSDDRPEEIRGLDLFRAPIQPTLGKSIITLNVGNTIKALKRGRLETREETLPKYIETRVMGDQRVHDFIDHSTLTGAEYKKALAELKTQIAAEEYGYQKAVNGLAQGNLQPSHEAAVNYIGMTCASMNMPAQVE
jgi:hypothetical protein